MSFEQGGAPFGLSDVKIAPWNSAGSFGTAVDVFSAQALNVRLRTTQAELTGDDVITSVASRATSGEITFRFGGVSIAALEVMTGNTATSSIASPANIKNLRIIGGEDYPFFAILGIALGSETDGQTEVFVPKAKIMGDLNLLQMEYGTFVIPEFTVMCVPDSSYGLINIIQAESTRAAAIPPANIATIS